MRTLEQVQLQTGMQSPYFLWDSDSDSGPKEPGL